MPAPGGRTCPATRTRAAAWSWTSTAATTARCPAAGISPYGAYGYLYPGANVDRAACGSAACPAPCALPSKRFDTLELDAGVTWKWIAYKLSVSAGDYFGAAAATGYGGSTRGTLYHDLSVTWPLGDDVSLVAHVGRTDVKARYAGVDADYTDYRIALTRSFVGGWNLGASVTGQATSASTGRRWVGCRWRMAGRVP